MITLTQTIFPAFLNMTITASYVILAVLIARVILKKAPKKYSYLLWSVPFFRLVCPFSFSSVLSIFNIGVFDSLIGGGGREMSFVTHGADSAQSSVTSGISALNSVIMDTVPGTASAAKVSSDITKTASVIWLAGVAVMLIYTVASYTSLRIKTGRAVRCDKNIYECDGIDSPFVLGLINPKIYIPFGLNEEEKTYILSHEKYHIKRGDFIVKPLLFSVLILHWFNPLAWLSFILAERDMEMSCDEHVITRADVQTRKLYSGLLLSFSVKNSGRSFCPLSFGENDVKGRVKNVLHFRKPAAWLSAICLVLSALLISSCGTNPVKNGPTTADSEIIYSDGTGYFTGGELISQCMYYSYLPQDGSLYKQIILSDYYLTVISNRNEILYSSDKMSVTTLSKKAFADMLKEQYVSDTEIVGESSDVKEVVIYKYYADEQLTDNVYSVIYLDGIPCWFTEGCGLRIYALRGVSEEDMFNDQMGSAVSAAILDSVNDSGSFASYSQEVHQIFGFDKTESDVTVYGYTIYSAFSFINGSFTDFNAPGFAAPFIVRYTVNHGTYDEQSAEILYGEDSLNKIPEKYRTSAENPDIKKLNEAKISDAKSYLEYYGYDCEVKTEDDLNLRYLPENISSVLYGKYSELKSGKYPEWIGSVMREDGDRREICIQLYDEKQNKIYFATYHDGDTYADAETYLISGSEISYMGQEKIGVFGFFKDANFPA